MKINERLKLVASFVEENKNVIDVGCDHALLDIYLNINRNNIRTVASDIKEGPLEIAKNNIKKYHLEDKIEVRLGNGIDTIDDKIDTIVISGMGGLTIIGILKYKKYLLKNVDTIILSPNNEVFKTRKEITKLGYFIEDEELIEEKKQIYHVIKFKKGKKYYTKNDFVLGPILKSKKSKTFITYLTKEKESLEKLLKILPKKYFKRRNKLKRELKEIKKVL